MAVKLEREPEMNEPVMLCGWPGIGNIGITAVETLRAAVEAEQFGAIEPFEFFDPRKVVIEDGLIRNLEFPESRFYAGRSGGRDILFFVGQEQPRSGHGPYAEGAKAYLMADMVLDVARKFKCGRIYTSGAAVTQIHHTTRPRVWAVPNGGRLVDELRTCDNTVLMAQVEGGGSQGVISGLNGLLLGVARKRGFDAVCLMGEIPYYLQAAPWPYPTASRSVLEVLGAVLGITFDLSRLDSLCKRVEKSIEQFLENLYSAEGIPPQVKEEIERLRHARHTDMGPITDEEKKRMLEHIDELFRPEDGKGRKHV
jgi:hypothetical protein